MEDINPSLSLCRSLDLCTVQTKLVKFQFTIYNPNYNVYCTPCTICIEDVWSQASLCLFLWCSSCQVGQKTNGSLVTRHPHQHFINTQFAGCLIQVVNLSISRISRQLFTSIWRCYSLIQ